MSAVDRLAERELCVSSAPFLLWAFSKWGLKQRALPRPNGEANTAGVFAMPPLRASFCAVSLQASVVFRAQLCQYGQDPRAYTGLSAAADELSGCLLPTQLAQKTPASGGGARQLAM